jgi:SAM-dependent methyltransferase
MTDGWHWDKTLFKGASAYYTRGRLPYAPGFAETLARALALDGTGRLLDVGCGPGIVTLALAPHFEEAVGLDPDEDMLAEAARQAALRDLANTRWVAGRAEDLPADLGHFRVVTFAQSFHWTDRDRVAATVLTMLEPGGAFVHIGEQKDASGESLPRPLPPTCPHPAPPEAEIRDLVHRYLGPVRRAGQGTLPRGTPSGRGRDEEQVLARAGFESFVRHIVPAGQVIERTPDDIVAWVYSLSNSAPHLFADRRADFEHDLRALLQHMAPDNRFAERLPPTEIMTWRKPRVEH